MASRHPIGDRALPRAEWRMAKGFPSAQWDGIRRAMNHVAATQRLTHLDRLEAESIHILRETVAEAARPVMLYSIGKDSAVMLHLARKAFFPAPLPFPLLHVDTGWKFRDMYALRDKVAAEPGIELIVHRNPEAEARRDQPVRPWPAAHRFVEDRGAEAGARPLQLRRGVRRGAARRGEEPGQGAHLQLPQRQPPLGPEEPAARTVVALQCPQEPRREHAGVPAVQLDRARRLAIYPCRGDRDRPALPRRAAPDGEARRPDPDGRRRALPLRARARPR